VPSAKLIAREGAENADVTRRVAQQTRTLAVLGDA
jgi:hypothetical protein